MWQRRRQLIYALMLGGVMLLLLGLAAYSPWNRRFIKVPIDDIVVEGTMLADGRIGLLGYSQLMVVSENKIERFSLPVGGRGKLVSQIDGSRIAVIEPNAISGNGQDRLILWNFANGKEEESLWRGTQWRTDQSTMHEKWGVGEPRTAVRWTSTALRSSQSGRYLAVAEGKEIQGFEMTTNGSRLVDIQRSHRLAVLRITGESVAEVLVDLGATPAVAPVRSLSFSPSEKHLAFGCAEGLRRVGCIDIDKKSLCWVTEGPGGNVAFCGERFILALDYGGDVYRYEAETGKGVLLCSISAPANSGYVSDRLSCIAVSPDGRFFAFWGDLNRCVFVCETSSGQERLRIPSETGASFIGFSPDSVDLWVVGSHDEFATCYKAVVPRKLSGE